MKRESMQSSGFVLMIVIIVSKLVGMVRDVVLANYFGTSNVSDAYLIASTVPTLLFYFIGHSLSTSFLPIYNKVRHAGGESSAQRYANNLINVAFILCTVITATLVLFPEIMVKIFAAGFDKKTAGIAAHLIRITAPSIYLMALISVFGGYLQAHNQFIAPAAISLPRNGMIMLSIVVASAWGTDWLGWGLLGAYIGEFAFLLPFVIKKGYRYRPIVDLTDKSMQETVYMVAPILLGMCVGQVNKIIDRSLASMVVEGGISALTYASVINNATQEVLVTGIITVLFASCAKLVAEGKHDAVKEKLTKTINTMACLLIPATIGIILLAEPIVRVLLSRGSFDATSVQMTAGGLRCYTMGLLFLAVRDTLVKVFYAYKDTKTTTITSISAIAVNIVFNFLLAKFWGINGLAIATSLSAGFNCVVLYVLLRKKTGDFGLRETGVTVLKSLLAAVVMVVGINVLFHTPTYAGWHDFVQLFSAVGVGSIIYFVVSFMLNNKAVMALIKRGD